MHRFEDFASPRWDDPFWHAVRMLVDVFKKKVPTVDEILPPLQIWRDTETTGLDRYLRNRDYPIERLTEYLQLRFDLADELLKLLRTEEEAMEDLASLSDVEVLTYGTQMAGHHQSPKVLVATVVAIAKEVCSRHSKTVNTDPQHRAMAIADDHLWVSPRRLDGAFPALTNPQAIWEIKEYWGKTKGGSKMSDAIYECQLVGTELRTFEDRHSVRIEHYFLIDGREQWKARQSDLRRAIDLLHCGLIDELIVGREVLTAWPTIMERLCDESAAD